MKMIFFVHLNKHKRLINEIALAKRAKTLMAGHLTKRSMLV